MKAGNVGLVIKSSDCYVIIAIIIWMAQEVSQFQSAVSHIMVDVITAR